MGVHFTSWRFLFFVLLSLLLAKDNSARRISSYKPFKGLVIDPIYGSKEMDSKEEVLIDDEIGSGSTPNQDMIKQVASGHNPIDDDHKGHTQMEHKDPSTNVFFKPSDLKVGQKLKVYFPNKDPSTSPRFLPKHEADSIPFTSLQLPYLLNVFNLSKDSPQAKAVEDTLKMCEVEPIKGETMLCATTLESMIDFARSIIGLDTQLKVLANVQLKNPTKPLQNYTIMEEAKELEAQRMVGCHIMPYPYVIYYCHGQVGHDQVKVFQVLLGGEDGSSVLAAAICHLDTSHWDRDHVSFRILKIEPGTGPVCHFLPPDNLVWLPVNV